MARCTRYNIMSKSLQEKVYQRYIKNP